MKLKQYLIENKTLYDVKQDCKPFLSKYSKLLKNEQFLWRGSDKIIRGIGHVVTRKNRKPTDTTIDLHNKLDELFKKRFGWKARSEGVFCTGKLTSAASYGHPYIMIPAGKFEFIWSPMVWDLFDELRNQELIKGYTGIDNPKTSFYDPKDEKHNIKLKYIIGTYINKNLRSAMRTHNEIIIKCDSYYLLEDDGFIEDL